MAPSLRHRRQHQADTVKQPHVNNQQRQPAGPLAELVVTRPAPTHLLDLPPDLLTNVLRQAPRSVRTTCHAFRLHLDAGRGSLRLRWHPNLAPQARHLRGLLLRSVHLRCLTCESADMPELSFITVCPALTTLFITGSHWPTNLTYLTSLPHLTDLHLHRCDHLLNLDNLAALSASCRLSTITLSSCVSLHDISALAGFSSLTHLDLVDTLGISDLRPLAACPSLTSLAVAPASAGLSADLRCLTLLTTLSTLVLKSEEDTNVEPLRLLTQLTSLTFSHPQLHHLGQLALPSLATLDATAVHVASVRPLARCQLLRSLFLSDCRNLADLAPLARCRSLATLHLASCSSLCDLQPLVRCLSLETLRFTRCHTVAAVRALRDCPALTELSFSSCAGIAYIAPIVSISLTAGSRSLRSLQLSRCPRVDAFAVVALLLRLEVLETPLPWLEKRHALSVVVDGKPASAPMIVCAASTLQRSAILLLFSMLCAWLVGARTWVLVLGLFSVPATTMCAVFWAHTRPASKYSA